MNINRRLKKVAEFVPSDCSFLDVGCDHALLDIYLYKDKEKNFRKVVASDNKQGPLDKAYINIKKEKLENKIELRLGDGLDVYTEDIDTVVISGMGGRSMIGIFKNHLEYLDNLKTIVLSPNNYQIDVKMFLVKNGFYIDKEFLVKEGKIIYQVIRFVKGKKRYSYRQYFFGPELLKHKNNIFFEYYGRELQSRKIILQLLPKGNFLRKIKLKREIKLLKQELELEVL